MNSPPTLSGLQRPGGRTERNRRAVAEAALRLLQAGETELSAARVAEESGVSLSTVYRRWPTRSDLLREAFTVHTSGIRFRETGDFANDLHALARSLARFFSQPAEIEMSAVMANHADPEFTRWQVEYFDERFEGARRLFETAIERGEIDPDCDPELLLEMLAGPMVTRTVVMRQKLTPSFTKRLAEGVVRAARGPRGNRS